MTPPADPTRRGIVEEGNGRYTVKEMLATVVLPKLNEISTKLDGKADQSLVTALQARLDDIDRHGSTQAVEALRELGDLHRRVSDVEKEQLSRKHLVAQAIADHEKVDDLWSERNTSHSLADYVRWGWMAFVPPAIAGLTYLLTH